MRKSLLIPIVLLMTCSALLVWAHSTGPDDGFTGAPGEGTCAESGCHDAYPPYAGFVVLDAPHRWHPGDTLDLQLTMLLAPEHIRRGFEITAVSLQGEPFGDFIVTDPLNTRLSVGANGRQYLSQTAAGSMAPDSMETSWSFRWAPPDTWGGMFSFWVAALSADGDSTAAGDVTLTLEQFVLDNTDCFVMTGDVNEDQAITSADIIYMVNHVFKAGPAPRPCDMLGDVNCSGYLSSADIIELTGVVFKGADLWCNVCNLWADGTWRCAALEW